MFDGFSVGFGRGKILGVSGGFPWFQPKHQEKEDQNISCDDFILFASKSSGRITMATVKIAVRKNIGLAIFAD